MLEMDETRDKIRDSNSVVDFDQDGPSEEQDLPEIHYGGGPTNIGVNEVSTSPTINTITPIQIKSSKQAKPSLDLGENSEKDESIEGFK